MTTRLRQALDDLASEVPPPAPAPELWPDLWHRGVRRRRRAWASAVAAAVAVLGGGAGVAASVSEDLTRDVSQVAMAPGTRLTMPSVLFQPSGWLPGTDEVGHPGRIAATWKVDGGRSRLLRNEDAWVAVSAADGSYRFLDEVGDAPDAELSPDGRYLAWPLPPEGGSSDGSAREVRGYAVYDAQTGKVTERRVEDAPYGVWSFPLVWSPDSTRLVTNACVVAEPDPRGDGRGDGGVDSSCRGRATEVWNVRSGKVTELDRRLFDILAGRSDRDLVVRRGEVVSALDLDTGALRRLGRVPGLERLQLTQLLYVDQARREVTVVGQNGEQLLLGLADLDGGPARFRAVDATVLAPPVFSQPNEVLAFVESGGRISSELIQITSDAGHIGGLELAGDGFTGAGAPRLAWDLVSGPWSPAEEPPTPVSRRLLVGVPFAALGLLGWLSWRLRRSPWRRG